MPPNRPTNSFRNSSPPGLSGTSSTNRPSSAPSRAQGGAKRPNASGRWRQIRAFMQKHPWLSLLYWGVVKTFIYGFILSLVWVVVLKYVPVWFTPLTISRKIDAIRTDKDSKIYKHWRALDDTSKEAALAVVASEDQEFPNHWGFDFDEIQDAIKENQYRKRPRGASTISQQVAKNVFLWNGRSYIRKLLEVYFTVAIELVWGKKRILEVYLNVAETGPMTFGVEAAAERFYGHSANRLNRDEAARIAAVLPNPILFSIRNPSNYVQRRSRQIARQMRALGGQAYIRNL